MFRNLANKAAAAFGYHAVESKGRRQAPQVRTYHERAILTESKRRKLIATARDANRNLVLLAWMIRKHLDYVSKFAPHVKTGNDELDKLIEGLFAWHADRRRFDAGKRHSRDRAMRIFEAMKVLDGDAFFLKLASGSLQGIEADRIAKATDIPREYADLVDDEGLVLDEFGAATHYAVTRRYKDADGRKNGIVGIYHDQIVEAQDVISSGYYSRWDQARGVSPLASALNTLQDLYEANEWTLLKIKLHALFGVSITREAADPDGFDATEEEANDVDKDLAETADNRYKVDLTNGVQLFDMDPGDKIDTIESKTPNSQYLEFHQNLIQLGLLALDLPVTFFDSRRSSFSARIADQNDYELSARDKRAENAAVLREYSDWKIAQWNGNAGMLGDAIRAAGMTVQQVQRSVEWIPSGMPWLDKLKEVTGDEKAVAMGVDSIPRIVKRRHNSDWRDILAENRAVYEAYREAGVPLFVGTTSQEEINALLGNDNAAQPE